MDMAITNRFKKSKDAGSIFHHKGRRVARYDPLPIEKKALIEAQEIMQGAGAGAMFSVYSQLSERYGSLIVLLPVSMTMTVTDQTIARALQQMQLVVASADKTYCLSWYFGIRAGEAKQDVAQRFNDDAEGALKSVREMLTYALHLCQTAKTEMQAYQASPAYQERLKNWEIIKKHLNYPHMATEHIEMAKRNIPNGGADLLSIEDERLYNYITSAFARQIADSQGAYAEHQRWRRELLLSIGDDSAGDAGGVNITMGR